MPVYPQRREVMWPTDREFHNFKAWRTWKGLGAPYFKSRLLEIHPKSVLLDTPDGPVTLKNDFVFAMTGYRPDTEFLAAHGVHFDPSSHKPFTDPETLESDRKGMFLAGVLVAGMHTNEIFIENGRFHGQKIAEAIARELAR